VAVVLLACATFLSTLGGGLIGLRANDRRHLVFGLTAGVMLGVVAFDLLPEVFRLGGTGGRVPGVMLAFAGGFLLLHTVERSVAVHRAHEGEYGDHHHPQVGLLSALALSVHSLIDGLSIGLAAQVDTKTLILVAVAVLGHDFADGMNTVSIMLAHRNTRRRAAGMLLVDAIAPVLGATLTLFVTIPQGLLSVYLGFFAGFLLYLATADILPEAHSKHPSQLTLACTVVGAAAMYGVVAVAGG
jgi:zinc and cadmium transporter